MQSIVTFVPLIFVLAFTRDATIRFFHEQLHLGFWATTFALVGEALVVTVAWVLIVQFVFRTVQRRPAVGQ